ncbi:lytic transglycosylase domain-containing protein [Streptomyces sp. NPDC046197]|uniref:lytic transglycosylase domain-containing protein n=1 Tax=Streptomyces sp. NPDC046197 TaxID=3154337 RepID=UPI0033C8C0DE
MAALTASQAPGVVPAGVAEPARRAAPADHGPSVSGDTPYRTELPPLRARNPAQHTGSAVTGGAVPASVFAAYRRAEAELARTEPACRLRWQLLAAIGQVESGQARGGRVSPDGTAVPPILGPRLDGGAFAAVRDTDGGVHDGDTVYDRAVGPMQFIPSTWARWGVDGNGDGRADPENVYDAALAAGRYLCAGGRDLSDPAELDRAILGYNHSRSYLRTVRSWYAYFLDGHRVVPDAAAGASAPPEPAPAGRPKPSPKPSAGRPDGAEPSASRTPSGPHPAPSPTPSGTTGTPLQPLQTPHTRQPGVPVPAPSVTLPGGGLLTGADEKSMGSSPSTTADTRR